MIIAYVWLIKNDKIYSGNLQGNLLKIKDRELFRQQCLQKNCCIVIPTYNNGGTLEKVVREVLLFTSGIIVVNDGSTDSTSAILEKFKEIEVITHAKNLGKGSALRSGFAYAIRLGYEHAITIDSDGQHFPEDLPVFLEKLDEEPGSLIVGSRNMQQEGIPSKSSFGHRFSNFWFWVETGIRLPDTQSGYRLYPLHLLKNMRWFTRKFEFEIEILVRAAWKGIPVISVPVKVIYEPKETRVSHFRPFRDFTRVSILNTILVFISLLCVYPFHFFKSFNKKNIQNFFQNQLFNTNEPKRVKVFSVMLGVFMGVAPVWGYQMALALLLAYLLKLNKVITFIASNISIPPFIPVILWLSYVVGGWIMPGKGSSLQFNADLSLNILKNNLIQYLTGSIILGIALALVFGSITYISILLHRKYKEGNMDNNT
jgi:glycosyltransferase involved in cell wall biosynthesis